MYKDMQRSVDYRLHRSVLAKRLERLEWKHHELATTVPTKKIAAMALDALIVDPAVLGPRS